MTSQTLQTPTFRNALAALGRFGGGILDALASASGAMRCAREVERLQMLSDAELAKLGLTRDRIVHHAFRSYLGC
jgi:uncharacterized protein YjiS (DUF1127 family)